MSKQLHRRENGYAAECSRAVAPRAANFPPLLPGGASPPSPAHLSEKARMDGSASASTSASARDGRRLPPPRRRSVCRTKWPATRVAARHVRPGSSSSGRSAVMPSAARRASAAAGPPPTARLKRTAVESARSGGAPAAVR
jgi:hypothetical protein